MENLKITTHPNAVTAKYPNRRATISDLPDGDCLLEFRIAGNPDMGTTVLYKRRLGVDSTAIKLSPEGVEALFAVLLTRMNK